MVTLQIDTIRQIADSLIIYKRGEFLQKNGAYSLVHEQSGEGHYVYEVDGNYGNYRTEIELNGAVNAQCDCPYPGPGCKHIVALLLELFDRQTAAADVLAEPDPRQEQYLSYEEIRKQALEDRFNRGKREEFKVIQGDTLKGDHLISTVKGRQYQVTVHDPATATGHCSCPDYHYNKLSTCKHLIFTADFLKGQKGFSNAQKQ